MGDSPAMKHRSGHVGEKICAYFDPLEPIVENGVSQIADKSRRTSQIANKSRRTSQIANKSRSSSSSSSSSSNPNRQDYSFLINPEKDYRDVDGEKWMNPNYFLETIKSVEEKKKEIAK